MVIERGRWLNRRSNPWPLDGIWLDYNIHVHREIPFSCAGSDPRRVSSYRSGPGREAAHHHPEPQKYYPPQKEGKRVRRRESIYFSKIRRAALEYGWAAGGANGTAGSEDDRRFWAVRHGVWLQIRRSSPSLAVDHGSASDSSPSQN